jgi:putative selenium metabolism hydrolase
METVGFDRVEIDPMGNVLGYIGTGRHLIAMDAHIDNVGVGNPENWKFDPFKGFEDDEVIGGRGASDQTGGMASLVYAGKIIKDLGLTGDYTLLVTGTVQEEDCDGLCWQYIVEKSGIRPEFVVSTEPTSCRIHRGARSDETRWLCAGGATRSAPGRRQCHQMGPILASSRVAHALADDRFPARGPHVSEIFTHPQPLRRVRRLHPLCGSTVTAETWEGALEEIRQLPAVRQAGAQVSLYDYARPSYTGLVYPTECYFPCWVIEERHPACQALVASYQSLFAKRPVVDKWTFSTNGVSIMGRYGIPCVGFGPGHEDQAAATAPGRVNWWAVAMRGDPAGLSGRAAA